MKNFLKKAAMLVSSCVLVFNLAVQSPVYAAEKEKITLSASSSSVKAGGSFTLTVATDAGSTGIGGVDIVVHYDSSKVTLNADDSATGDSSFLLVPNYSYASGEVLIMGAASTNVKKDQTLAKLKFKMKSGASGKANFWVEVRKMVYYDSAGAYADCSYSVPTKSSPVTVSVKAETTTKATTTTAKKTTTTTTKKSESTTKKPETTKEKTTTTSDKATKTETQKTAEPVVIGNGDAVFAYTNEGEFDEDSVETYSFSLGDYAEDFSKGYDITIAVKASDEVVGAVGYNNESGVWTTASQHSYSGESVWTAEDVQVRESDDLIYVQLYFMAPDSSFEITKVTIQPHGTVAATQSETTPTEATTTTTADTSSSTATDQTTAEETTAASGDSASTSGTTDFSVQSSTRQSVTGSSTGVVAAVTDSDSNKPKRDSGYVVFVFVLAFLEIFGTAVLITYKRVKFRQDAYTETY